MSVTKEKKSEYNKRYFEKHKDELKTKAKEMVECDKCKKYVSKGALYEHRQTKIHKVNCELYEAKQKNKKKEKNITRVVNSLQDNPSASKYERKKAKKLIKLLDN